MTTQDLTKLTVASLKERLRAHGLPLKGAKAELIARLTSATPNEAESEQPAVTPPPSPAQQAVAVAHVASPADEAREGSGQILEASLQAEQGAAGADGQKRGGAPLPGTAQLDEVASAQVCLLTASGGLLNVGSVSI